jgi:hypothetical protein
VASCGKSSTRSSPSTPMITYGVTACHT